MEIKFTRKTMQLIYFMLFTISGFSGLIYESIWTHYLKLFLGSAAYSQTLVLIIFMGCMALGSWLTGRYSLKIRNLLLIYAIAEAIIGILALFFHSIFIGVTNFTFFSIIPQVDSVFLVRIIKWSLAAVMIIPQTILLGSTFPLMSGGLIRGYSQKPGRTLAILYFTNSIGGAVGVLISGFVLINAVGLPGTVLFAGVINIILALIVWLMSHNTAYEPVKIGEDTSKSSEKVRSKKIFVALLLCAALTGTASFLYEIGWIRMLSLVLGASTHAFEIMLSAFIFGIAIGGFWIKKRIDSFISPIKTLGIIQIIMGVLALFTLILYGRTFYLMSFILQALAKTIPGYGMFNVFSHIISMLIMVPVTICAGMTLPLITYYLLSKGYGEGSIGKTYGANTLGAIVGVILAIQLIMPLMGVKNVIIFGGAIDIMLGLALLWYGQPTIVKKTWYFLTAGMICILVFFISGVHLDTTKMSSGVFRFEKIPEEREILFHKDGKTATVDLFRTDRDLVLSTNGKPDASIGLSEQLSGDELTQVLIGAIPLAINKNYTSVACIGIGSGMTSHIVLANPTIEYVDVIEIEKAMVEAAKGFGSRVENTFRDPRCTIYIEDAKTFFTNYQKKYDVIISEPSNPWVSGVASLFTREFYHQVKNNLTERGIFVQWIQLYEINIPLVASVIKSLSIEFRDYSVYFMDNGNILLISGEHQINDSDLHDIFTIPNLKLELNRVYITNIYEILLRKLGSKVKLDPLFHSYEISLNSDYFPILDNNAVRARYLSQSAYGLYALKKLPNYNLKLLPNDNSLTELVSINKKVKFNLTRDVNNAIFISNYFKEKSPRYETETENIDKEVLETIRIFRSIHHQPRIQELIEVWVPALHQLADYTLPFLDKGEMKYIWDDLESAPIVSQLPDTITNWIGLYKSISNQQYRRCCEFIYELLPDLKIIKNTPINNRILIYAMSAHNALHQYVQVLKLFARYENQVNYPLEIRYLKEQAEQALGRNRGQ